MWGEDLIINYPQLIDTTPTVALTYVEVLRLAHPPPSFTTLAAATLTATSITTTTSTTITTTSLQVLRLDRADMLAVAMMHPVVEARIKRAAVRRRPNSNPDPDPDPN